MPNAYQDPTHLLSVPEAIRHLRNWMGQTQTQFSVRIGVAGATLARYETAAQSPKPSVLKTLIEMAEQEGFAELAEALRLGFRSSVERKIARSSTHGVVGSSKRETEPAINDIEMLANSTLLRARQCVCDPQLPGLSDALQLALRRLVSKAQVSTQPE